MDLVNNRNVLYGRFFAKYSEKVAVFDVLCYILDNISQIEIHLSKGKIHYDKTTD